MCRKANRKSQKLSHFFEGDRENKHITKTCLYTHNFDPLKPHFYIVKLGFTGICISYLIFAQKHGLWVLIRTAFDLLDIFYVSDLRLIQCLKDNTTIHVY